MTDQSGSADAWAIDGALVRSALCAALASRGHRLSGDTAGTHRPLYIMGANDLARVVFEFKPSADDAVYDLIYQGAWVAGMPARFVVLPGTEAQSLSLETLEQVKATPLFFDTDGQTVTFREFDTTLQGHLDLE